jgi:hypothetical protein
MITRQQTIEKLHRIVAESRANGGVVSTAQISKALLEEFPDCGISSSELEILVAKEAAKSGVAVSIDGHH